MTTPLEQCVPEELQNLFLIYSRRQWETGYDKTMNITKDELDAAEKRENGFIKQSYGVDCYLTRWLPSVPKCSEESPH
jgi:hypothetical protein